MVSLRKMREDEMFYKVNEYIKGNHKVLFVLDNLDNLI